MINKKQLSVLLLTGLMSSSALASEYEPAAAELFNGELLFTPVVDISMGYDTNVAHAEENEQSSLFSVLSTSGTLQRGHEISLLTVGYQLTKGSYADSADDNYLDYMANLLWQHEFTARHRIALDVKHERSHEARGLGISETFTTPLNSPIEYEQNSAGFSYGIGVKSATLNGKLSAKYSKREHLNFADYTKQHDKGIFNLGANVSFRLRPQAALTLDLVYNNNDYDYTPLNRASRSGDDYRALLGAKWDIAGKTDGYAKLGYQSKTFDDSTREDANGITWDVGVMWSPRTYSIFNLETGRAIEDSIWQGDSIATSRFKAVWKHQWLKRLASQISLNHLSEDYSGVVRRDITNSVTASLEYDFRRWFKVVIAGQHTGQNSDLAHIEYDKNLIMLSMSASL